MSDAPRAVTIPRKKPSPLQAWDNVIGQNMAFNRNTGLGAVAVAGVVGAAAVFTEFKQ